MSIKQFLTTSEHEDFESFLRKLEEKMRIKYVSNLNAMALVPKNYTGIYISSNNQVITVIIEINKNSLKTITA